MALLQINHLNLQFSGPPLLDNCSLMLDKGERVCLMGRNGEGKSTLLKIVAGLFDPDSQDVIRQPRLNIAYLPQEVPQDLTGTVTQVVSAGFSAEHALEDYEKEVAVATAISQVELNPQDDCASLSGGQRRRVLLARTLVNDPDILLLDEPTNHLDIPSIQWLENLLTRLPCCLLFVSHDRAFVRQMATRILELDRGQLTSWDCAYDRFVEYKEARLEEEARSRALFDKRLTEEETWIRQGIKARRTRNEGRVRALKRMREEHRTRRNRQGSVHLEIGEAERSGKLVVQVQGLKFHWPEQPIVENLDFTMMRGDRIGIIGPNGSGKTTLLKILLGELQPQQGSIRLGSNLELAYFDQLRQQLNPAQTLLDNIGDGKEIISINGKNRHVLSYLGDFLFSADRARGPISALSGGEKNRLLLARIFSRPSNLLVLDEPTNDLDMETLDLLEERIAEYQGSVIVVSHDREFLDRIVNTSLILEGQGLVHEFVGGYSEWESFRIQRDRQQQAQQKSFQPSQNTSEKTSPTKTRKLRYHEQRELEQLPERIETLEASLEKIQEQLANPAIYTDHLQLTKWQSQMEKTEAELLEAYTRWEELS